MRAKIAWKNVSFNSFLYYSVGYRYVDGMTPQDQSCLSTLAHKNKFNSLYNMAPNLVSMPNTLTIH